MEAFLKTISHPNRRELAVKLFNGVPAEELYAEYGQIKVQEMQQAISNYQEMPENHRAIPGAGCRACRRNGTCAL